MIKNPSVRLMRPKLCRIYHSIKQRRNVQGRYLFSLVFQQFRGDVGDDSQFDALRLQFLKDLYRLGEGFYIIPDMGILIVQTGRSFIWLVRRILF